MASFFGLGRNRQKGALELAHETKELTTRLAQDEKVNPKVRRKPQSACRGSFNADKR
jgi:hypothetical protein